MPAPTTNICTLCLMMSIPTEPAAFSLAAMALSARPIARAVDVEADATTTAAPVAQTNRSNRRGRRQRDAEDGEFRHADVPSAPPVNADISTAKTMRMRCSASERHRQHEAAQSQDRRRRRCRRSPSTATTPTSIATNGSQR